MTLPCFLAKVAQILQKVIVFFRERGEEIDPWFWHILIAQWLKSCYCLSFSIPAIFRGKWVVTVRGKVETLGPCLFHGNSNFCLLQYYLWWEFRQYWNIFGGVRAQKPPKKGYFMVAESVRKTLKTFDLTTTNTILIKLTMIMYIHENVNRKPFRARKSVFWRNVYEFLDYIKNRYICHVLPSVT